ncbi:FAD:protein FMN transferase [Marinobacter sp. X15-166B]|uniref:FAD:protein FMN transferase n=1 Tax=Marinobacter sp. X15-166B TaxID=1897620 RepID=UPI00085BF6EA|nr:FAD:protein FMN transferase [Marinobacter sp. X15-166B]OEY67122.1 FAD:protein FMN transferase ApbE [Marinobacter sp. X15-166B]
MTSCMLRPARAVITSAVMALVIAALAGCSFEPEQQIWEISGPVFGTSYHVKVVLPEDTDQLAALAEGIDAALARVDASMSTWRPDSELSRFNNAADQSQWFAISTPLYEVLSASLQLSEFSGGSFDITVGPVVNLWGFGPEATPETVPEPALLAERMAQTGYRHIELRADPPAVRTSVPQYLDLSAIAKGYGTDAVARYLTDAGIESFLVEVGGEISARGRKPGGDAWRLAIEEPVSDARRINRIVALDGQAMATSGDYRNYYESEGKRYSHTIDPSTGKPVSHTLASVTVIAESAMLADGYATAFTVLGYEQSRALATRENMAVYFIVREEDGFAAYHTPAFSSFLTE